MKIELSEMAAQLGYKSSEKPNPNKTLAGVVESADLKYWEAFPVLLANAAEGGKLDLGAVNAALGEDGRKYLRLLAMISLALYDAQKARFAWRDRLAGAFPARIIAGYKAKLEAGIPLELGEIVLRPSRLEENFRDAFAGRPAILKAAARHREEDALEAALSTLFTDRQRELIMKRLRRERLGKTEREYYSRVVKKKLLALANEELHRLARRALA